MRESREAEQCWLGDLARKACVRGREVGSNQHSVRLCTTVRCALSWGQNHRVRLSPPAKSCLPSWQTCGFETDQVDQLQAKLGDKPSSLPTIQWLFVFIPSSQEGPEVYITTQWSVFILMLFPNVESIAFFVRILGISDPRGQRRIYTPPPPMDTGRHLGVSTL